MAHWNLRNRLPCRLPGRWFWIGAAVIAVISIVGIYGIWNANIQMLRYLTIRQAQSGSPQISAFLKEFGEEIYLNIFLQAFLFILVELGLVICFLFMARHRHLRQDLAELSAHFESLVDYAGQLNLKPLAVQGNDETASLIRRFNQVIEKLKPSYQTLEETLARQSRTLEEVRSRRQQEIERRRQVEKELVLRQFIVDHAGEAIYLVGKDGQIAEVNEVACSWLGYSRPELLSLTIMDIDPHLSPET
jgi:PAS domain-containing protein